MTLSVSLIIFLCHARGQGLLYNMVDWLIALADQASDEFKIVGLSVPEEQEHGLFDRLRAHGVANLQVVQSLTDPVAIKLLSQAAVVHCHGFHQLAELHQLRRRIGASFRCVISIHYFRNGTIWKVPFSNFISGTLLNKAAHMLHYLSMRSQTEFTDTNFFLKRTLPYYIFPLGCDEEKFPIDGRVEQPQEWEHLATLSEGRPNIVYLANFFKNKQHRWLIDAIEKSLLRNNAVLWLLGEGPEREAIQELIRLRALSKHVICPGRVQRLYIPWFLSYMQVAVCSSLSENSPHAIMEPLFAGVPVVTFDVGTASELVSDFSRGFVLGKPRVQGEFARKVDIILENSQLRRHMAKEAKHFVAQFYTWRDCARKSMAMYRTMLQH